MKGLIEESVNRVQQGSKLVNNAAATMIDIVSSVTRVNDIMGEIASAAAGQEPAKEQVAQVVTRRDREGALTSSLPCGQTSLLLQMTERLALSDAHFRRISQLIYQRAGIVLADHKRDMVYNRLVRRLRSLGLTDFGHYLNLLESNQHSGEWQAFINSLTTNLTAFFREAHHFPLLADHARRRSGEYRVWSAAASTGEEPYSIAMTLADTLGTAPGRW
ncbi:CheR family methyltransferase, partial [Escherichia marmotae]|nr:CheR family methyltransferase [Escherichia marmotae]